MNRKWKVYKIQNLINNKIYIGVTSQDPEKRWARGMAYKGNRHFTNAIKKYGWDNFSHEILHENLSREEAGILEEYYIKKLNLLNPSIGYNKDPGGFQNKEMYKDYVIKKLQKPVNKYDINGNFLCSYSSLVEAAFDNDCLPNDISLCCNKKHSKTVKGYVYRFSDSLDSLEDIKQFVGQHGLNTAIVQYSADGAKIQEYKSIKEASIHTGINSCNISLCCSGYNKKAGGFIWKKSNELLTQEEIDSRNKREANYNKIQQFSLTGELIAIYDNAKIAGECNHIDSSGIIKCCKHKYNKSGGYIWRYLE